VILTILYLAGAKNTDRYIIHMVSPEFYHIYWFEKINSLIIIPNFTMKIQSIDASTLV
jgi:hypothetical protein